MRCRLHHLPTSERRGWANRGPPAHRHPTGALARAMTAGPPVARWRVRGPLRESGLEARGYQSVLAVFVASLALELVRSFFQATILIGLTT
jgi:hypothetical protein